MKYHGNDGSIHRAYKQDGSPACAGIDDVEKITSVKILIWKIGHQGWSHTGIELQVEKLNSSYKQF
jgi:hypothetical protein